MDLELSYRLCQQITRHEAKNFYYAFITLPREKRRAIYAVYAFCREADDIADADSSIEEKRIQLDKLRARLDGACVGDPQGGTDIALSDAITRFAIDSQDLAHVIDGVEMDLVISRYETFPDLQIYCYRVASAVGLSVLPILAGGGERLAAQVRATGERLGLGMQLANIVRDVAEDIRIDRVYIPQEDLRRFGVSEEMLRVGRMDDKMRNLLSFESERARQYISEGERVSEFLPRNARRCIALLGTIYTRILEMAAARGYDVFRERLSLSSRQKIGLILRTWFE
ncbi:MAG: phytoene/squalene synthase family protein [Candidatus Bipolaricaulota bacterium]|nr:phytoene/squalene synthase family protein [Candidatus Bipolaricaulota bacterium]